MSSEKIFERVKKVISETFNINIERITLEDSLFLGLSSNCRPKSDPHFPSILDFSHYPCPKNSLNMQGLDGLELSIALEEEFDIDTLDKEADGEKSMSVKDLVEFIALRIVQDN